MPNLLTEPMSSISTDLISRINKENPQLLKYALIGGMTRQVSHEMNNYLTGIIGYIQLAMKSAWVDAKTRNNMMRLLQYCESAKLMNCTLAELFSPIPHEELLEDIGVIVNSASAFCNRIFGPNCSVVVSEISPAIGIAVPETSLKEMLIFLLLHAKEIINSKGEIIVRVGSEDGLLFDALDNYVPFAVIEIAAKALAEDNPNSLSYLNFSDLPQKTRDFQASASLLLAQSLASQWNGGVDSICLENHLSIYRLRLPQRFSTSGSQVKTYSSSDSLSIPSRPIRIVLLEDQELISDFIQISLEKEGHSLEVFHDGLELEQYLKQTDMESIDIYILDVLVPSRSGLEVARTIRKKSQNSKILFYSALSQEEDISQEFPLNGNTKFLAKPFKKEDLLKNLYEMTSKD